MGQQVVYIENNLDGLMIKGVGTFAKGAKWSVDTVPAGLIKKLNNKETFINSKGNVTPIASCFAADGSEVEFANAYIQRFNIGSPPVPPDIHESSKKTRNVHLEEDESEGENIVEENDEELSEGELSDESDEKDASVKNKKKKKKNKSQ